MAAPITPNLPYDLYDGQVVLMWCDFTAGGATTAITFDLPTYAPNIDIRLSNPVLSMVHVSNEGAGAVTDREVWLPQNEVLRASAGTATGEWSIQDQNTLGIYLTADANPGGNGIIAVSYIAFGGTLA